MHVGSVQQTSKKRKCTPTTRTTAVSLAVQSTRSHAPPTRGDTHTYPLPPSLSPPVITMIPSWSFRAVRSPLRNFGGTGAAGLAGGSPIVIRCSGLVRRKIGGSSLDGGTRDHSSAQHQTRTHAHTSTYAAPGLLTFNIGGLLADAPKDNGPTARRKSELARPPLGSPISEHEKTASSLCCLPFGQKYDRALNCTHPGSHLRMKAGRLCKESVAGSQDFT